MDAGSKSTRKNCLFGIDAKDHKSTIAYQRRSTKASNNPLLEETTTTECTTIASDPTQQKLQGDHGTFHKKHHQSWIKRSLSSRGRRTSIISTEAMLCSSLSPFKSSESLETTASLQVKHSSTDKGNYPKERCPKNNAILISPNKHQRKRIAAPADFIREQQALYAEVDAFELQEETPSPVKSQSFMLGAAAHDIACKFYVHSSSLQVVPEESFVEGPRQNPGDAFSSNDDHLSVALSTPECVSTLQRCAQESTTSSNTLAPLHIFTEKSINSTSYPSSSTRTDALDSHKLFDSTCLGSRLDLLVEDLNFLDIHDNGQLAEKRLITVNQMPVGDVACQNRSTSKDDCFNLKEGSPKLTVLPIFDVFLRECGQTTVMTMREVISDFCDINKIVKLGEGTYGEAFKENGNVIKIVPMDGNFKVNGEIQKTPAEMYNEVLLTNALSKLRSTSENALKSSNICDNFIETKLVRICQGKYDARFVHAWEEWDAVHRSENDHPMVFPSNQLYVGFVQADGGKDLESFILSDFREVRSVLLQLVLSLAVAEEACGFEHRDLHWGNIVIARKQEHSMMYRLQGKHLEISTYGVSVSIIDFTLSRIHAGNQVLFCNLSVDPNLFEGPKGDIQAETYRRMLKVTGGQWEGRFPKTNALWIHYAVDTIMNRKSFHCSSKEKGKMRLFRKQLLLYDSAKAASADKFFEGMFI